MNVFEVIEKVAATPSKKDKEALLKQHDSEMLRFVCEAAYNPRKRYNLNSKVAGVAGVGNQEIDVEDAAAKLQSLQDRQISGSAAVAVVTRYLESLTPKSAELFKRVLNKDLRAGFSDSTINKVWKGLIPEYPYQRCSLFSKVDTSKWTWRQGVYSQEKMDGMYANVTHQYDGEVTIASRQGTDFPLGCFGTLVDDLKIYVPIGNQLHGELLVKDEEGNILPREIGNGILNSVAKGGDIDKRYVIVFVAWDMVPVEVVVPKGKYTVPYSRRFELLASCISSSKIIKIVPTEIVHSVEEAMKHYEQLLAQGKEGTVLKNGSAAWRDGTSKEQLKLKLEVDVDLEIIGFNPGEGKNASTFGSIACRTADGLLEVNVSGFSDDDRIKLNLIREETVGKIMTVRSNQIMKPSASNKVYSLFLPRCIEIREDKVVADTLQQVLAQFDNAIKGK